MDSDDRDTEIFERIPWDALDTRTDRRWWLYVGVGLVVAAAIGVSVGRSGAFASAPPPSVATAATVPPSTPPSSTVAPPTTTPLPTAPAPATGEAPSSLTEADLMAVPTQTWEMMAVATAEWFVADFFSRDGGDGATSFVEFVRAIEVTVDDSGGAAVTVLVRRLAAPVGESYQRVPDEAWGVNLVVGADGWEVDAGPFLTEAPDLVVSERAPGAPVPPGVADLVDGEPVAAVATDDGWDVETEWTDAAGVTWPVLQHVGSEALGDQETDP